MTRRPKLRRPVSHCFRNKLLLNQWLIGLFGIDPLGENKLLGQEGPALSLAYSPLSHTRAVLTVSSLEMGY